MKSLIAAAAVIAVSAWTSSAMADDVQPAATRGSLWDRITLDAPLLTHHFPNDSRFNDHNWGLFVEFTVHHNVSFVAGDFTNSFRRNTAFIAVAYMPTLFDSYHIKINGGGMLGLDLNDGYKGHNYFEPAMSGFGFKIHGNHFEDRRLRFLNRTGVLITVFPPGGPGTSTAVNAALSYRL
jgi:hypothetical protein